MTEEQIRYSKVIAEFMGWKFAPSQHITNAEDESAFYRNENGYREYLRNFRYHISYEWLMPVWVKFRDLRFSEVGDQMAHSAWKQRLATLIPYCEIDEFFKELAKAIEGYNSIRK